MPEVTIREAGADDIPAASDLLYGCGYRDDLHRLAALRFIQEAPQGGVFVAEDGTAVVAVSAALAFGATGWLSALGVDPGWRRRGVATQLMDAVHSWARQNEYESIRFECHNQHRPMLHLAIELGYDIVGIRWDPDRGDNLVIFEKVLAH